MSEQTKTPSHRPITNAEKIAAGAFAMALVAGPVYAQLQESPVAQRETAKYMLGIYGELALGAGMVAFAKKAAEQNRQRNEDAGFTQRVAEVNRLHMEEQAANLQTYVVQPPDTQR